MNRLKETREAAGLRREDVASKADISYDYVRRLEAPDPPTPGLDIARRLADALGTTVDELFPEPADVSVVAPSQGAR